MRPAAAASGSSFSGMRMSSTATPIRVESCPGDDKDETDASPLGDCRAERRGKQLTGCSNRVGRGRDSAHQLFRSLAEQHVTVRHKHRGASQADQKPTGNPRDWDAVESKQGRDANQDDHDAADQLAGADDSQRTEPHSPLPDRGGADRRSQADGPHG